MGRRPERKPHVCVRRSRGFTLLELMMVVALTAVILAVGAPSFRDFRRNAHLTGIANDLLASTQLARTEAIKRQVPVSICPAQDARAAVCAGESFSGWIVFVDPDGDCSRTSPATEVLLGQEAPGDTPVSVTANGTCISFGAKGFLRAAGGRAPATQILFCDERGTAPAVPTAPSPARGLRLLPTGRGQITREPATLASWELPCAG